MRPPHGGRVLPSGNACTVARPAHPPGFFSREDSSSARRRARPAVARAGPEPVAGAVRGYSTEGSARGARARPLRSGPSPLAGLDERLRLALGALGGALLLDRLLWDLLGSAVVR